MGLRQSPAESASSQQNGNSDFSLLGFLGRVNEIDNTYKVSGTALAHNKSSTRGGVLPLIPKAFPKQHCGARPVLGAGRQRNSTLNGQAVAPSQVGRQPHNSRQSDAIAKERQRPRAQMQTLGQHRCPSQEAQSRLGQRPSWGKGNIQSQEIGLHSHSSVAILLFF